MKTCETCKYWVTGVFGVLGNMTCRCPKMKIGCHHDPRTLADDEVIIESDDGWGWLVGPDFGCVHHKDKEYQGATS